MAGLLFVPENSQNIPDIRLKVSKGHVRSINTLSEFGQSIQITWRFPYQKHRNGLLYEKLYKKGGSLLSSRNRLESLTSVSHSFLLYKSIIKIIISPYQKFSNDHREQRKKPALITFKALITMKAIGTKINKDMQNKILRYLPDQI